MKLLILRGAHKASSLESCLENVSHAAASSMGVPAKQARLVTIYPVDAASIDQCDSTGSVLRGSFYVVYEKTDYVWLNDSRNSLQCKQLYESALRRSNKKRINMI